MKGVEEFLYFLGSSLLAINLVNANDALGESPAQFESGEARVALLEVYSSQGCSSCPPAEKWINQFTVDPDLWRRFIPLVFHVDYWDDIGWKDPFSDRSFSLRQRALKRQGLIDSVYTPGFTLNGREWRGWFAGKSLPLTDQKAGNLKLQVDADGISASYSEFASSQQLNIAVIGFGLETYVATGENRQHTLIQDFVVLDFNQYKAVKGGWTEDWQPPTQQGESMAVVA